MVLTEEKYKELTKGKQYWSKRWNYIGFVADLVRTLEYSDSVEAGTEGIKIISTSREIKSIKDFDLNSDNWPFKTDLFIALQVFEHLSDKVRAFENLKRCSKQAIISLPYMWQVPETDCHFGIDEKTIYGWTKVHPKRSVKRAARIINYYKW